MLFNSGAFGSLAAGGAVEQKGSKQLEMWKLVFHSNKAEFGVVQNKHV